MKFLKLSVIALIISLAQVSCNPPKEDAKLEPTTIEEGKALIENSAIDLLSEVDDFKNDDAINELYDLAKEMNSKSSGKKQSTFLFNSSLNDVVLIKEGKMDLTSLSKNHTLANINLNDSDDFQDKYNEAKGIYEWSDVEEDFVKTKSSENIIFIVDYSIEGKNKQAQLIASNFSSEYLNSKIQVVNSLNVVFTIDGKELMSYSFSSEFDRYLPKSIISEYKLGTLSFTETFNNLSNKELKNETDISINGKSLINYSGSVTGDFNELNTQGEDYKVKEGNIPVDKSSMELTIFEVKIAGDIDYKSLNEGIKELSDDSKKEDLVELLNNNTSIVVSSGNKEIAKAVFFVGISEYVDWVWDNDKQEYKEVTITEEEVDIHFVFSDDSKVDFETYFGENFSKVEEKLNSVIKNYTSKFDIED